MMKLQINGIDAFVEDNDQYLQINDVSASDLRMIWERVKTDYASYDKWLCFRNTDIPYVLLDELGAVLKDDCIEMRLYADKMNESETLGVEQVSDETFGEFATLHDERNPDMYWTGERLLRDLSKWGIFCLRLNERIANYIIMSMRHPTEAEIFCIEAYNSAECKKLIACAAKYAFGNGKSEVLYQADNDLTHEAALSIGFTVNGFYKGYMVKHI